MVGCGLGSRLLEWSGIWRCLHVVGSVLLECGLWTLLKWPIYIYGVLANYYAGQFLWPPSCVLSPQPMHVFTSDIAWTEYASCMCLLSAQDFLAASNPRYTLTIGDSLIHHEVFCLEKFLDCVASHQEGLWLSDLWRLLHAVIVVEIACLGKFTEWHEVPYSPYS